MSIVNIEALKGLGNVLWWPGSQATGSMTTKAITAVGDVKQILPFSGAGIGMFDGTGDYLDVTNWNSSGASNIGSSNFTIEGWIYLAALPNAINVLVGNYSATNASNEHIVHITASNCLNWYVYQSGVYVWIITSPTLSTGWTHFACIRNESSQKMYVNGLEVGTAGTSSGSVNNHTSALKIGSWYGNQAFNGYISELRWSSVARYTANFTPPRHQLESDANTKLLLHFNRNDTTFIDSSPSAHTITRYGDAKQLCSPCGSGVAYFDGSGDALTVGTASDFNFLHNVTTGSKYSISLFLKIMANSIPQFIISNIIGGAEIGSRLNITSTNQINYLIGNGTTTILSIIASYPQDNNWHYVTVTYDYSLASDNCKMFLDGSLIGTANNPSSPSSSNALYPISIGARPSSLGYPANGYISDIIIKNGACIDGTIVPTQPFVPDVNTKLLLHMDGQGNAFYDSSDPPGDNGFPILPAGVTVTPSGTFTSIKGKDGQNYYYFNSATPNRITLSDLESWTLGSNNFTISLWAKMNTVNAIHTLFHLFAATNSGVELYTNASAKLCLKVSDTSTAGNMINTTGSVTLEASTWYHIAVVRNGSAFTVYLNCVSDSTGTSSATIINPTSIAIGCRPTGTPDQYQLGCIKDLQLFAGKALTQDQIAAIMQETYIY